MKNLSTMHKRILGVIFMAVVMIAFVSTKPVYALSDDDYCKSSTGQREKVPESTLVNRYGLKIEQLDNNQYKISMNPTSNREERCKTTLKLVKVNNTSKNQSITCSSPLTITETNTTTETMSGLPGITFTIEGTDIIKNENQANSCYYEKGEMVYELSVETAPEVKRGNCPTVQMEDSNITIGSINCSNSYAAGTFEQKFCYAKTHATKKYDDSSSSITNGRFSGSIDELTFKCEGDVTKIPTNPDQLTGENYFVNKYYIYGSTTQTVTATGPYTYHYAPGVEVTGNTPSCEVTCEEAVDVEFGPPVASRAGGCFEYKVRVTSRVSCNMTKAPEAPPADCSYRTPTPHCVSANGSVWLQGGPNEEFDACVKTCDGGKYTQKCSNKCYKKVYGTSAKKTNMAFYEDVMATQLVDNPTFGFTLNECLTMTKADGSKYNPTGCYYVSGSSILWGHLGTAHVQGRWYAEHPGGKYHNGQYILARDDGFWRHNYGNGNYCHDNCSWIGSTNSYYLNPGFAEKDYELNMEKYNSTIRSCKAAATCKTETAEFTISADYTKRGQTTSTTINFPYDNQKDSVKHTGTGKATTTADQGNTTLLPDYPSSGEGFMGCYKNDDTKENRYRVTWGFPGSWKSLKTGEISYTPVNDNEAWPEYSHQFCIPGDAKSVNVAWWNAYKHKQLVDSGLISGISASAAWIDELCQYSSSSSSIIKKDYTDVSSYMSDIEWNINAITREFGYFGWDIKMQCFYAMNIDPICTDKCCEEGTCSSSTYDKACKPPTPDDNNYRVRSTNLEDMFPATDGTATTSTDNTGRNPGFNWSQYAINNKNTDYKSNPVKYYQELQRAAQNGTEIYTDSNLDYEFELSPKVLRDMRKDQAGLGGSNYTAFNESGFSIDANGVGRYYSQKIRDLEGNKKIAPKDARQLLCNNMVNWSSTECDSVHEG